MISESQFDEQFKPLAQSQDGDLLTPRYSDALTFASTEGLGESHIWAVTEGDDDDSLYANPGPHAVNVVGYLVTEKPWLTGDEVAVYFEDDSEDLSLSPGV
ncbi:hypothetical protein [Marinobacter nauticus]|uniref:Uncharacterized protein n=1 Tax=Marinobacter nauticus (strain ATCC 700491 / DSM 11845 / VT8) TaxID=351348 RepID=A1U7X9_MARN8|nr:hypothetical protein [Marinobacter nauticus]ABM21098.1 hypothetical protein Maqu_4247 [Marinobacter nauticus VT8]